MSPGATSGDLPTLTLVTAIYLMAVGYRGYRSTRSSTDYLLAGRDVPPLVMALSYGATFISTAAIVGFFRFARDPATIAGLPRIVQTWGVRPHDGPRPVSAVRG